MKKLTPGTEIDGFVVEDCIHAGGMAHIYSVRYAQPKAASPGFPMVMKIPRMRFVKDRWLPRHHVGPVQRHGQFRKGGAKTAVAQFLLYIRALRQHNALVIADGG